MKSIVLVAPGQVEVREVPVPTRQKGEVLLKMLWGGVCGSDLAAYRGKSAYVSYPRTIGHEFAAQVVEADPDSGLRAGQIVCGNPYFNCGHCYSCRRGFVNCCVGNQTMGVQREGAFSEYFLLPQERVYDGGGIAPQLLALAEPMCISYHGVSRAKLQPGETVMIAGAGAIGVLAAVCAKKAGARVYITDIVEKKAEFAANAFSLAGFFAYDPATLAEQVRLLTNGDGFDATVEAVGAASTFLGCVEAAAPRGRVVVIGVSKENADFNFTLLQRKELNLYGSRAATKEDFGAVLSILRSDPKPFEKLISRVYAVADAQEAFREMDGCSAQILKAEFKF